MDVNKYECSSVFLKQAACTFEYIGDVGRLLWRAICNQSFLNGMVPTQDEIESSVPCNTAYEYTGLASKGCHFGRVSQSGKQPHLMIG